MAKLEDLDAHEVSLVPEGANQKRFIIRKEDGELNMEDQEIIEEIMGNELKNEDGINAVAKESKLSENDTVKVKAATRILQALEGKLPPAFMAKLSKLAGIAKEEKKEEKSEMKKEDSIKEIKKEEAKEESKAESTEIKKEDMKDLSPEMQGKIEAIFKSNSDLLKASEKIAKENESLTVTVKEEKDARILKEFKDTAKDEFSHISNSDELAPILKEMAENLSEGVNEKLVGILKQAEQISTKSDIFREAGHSLSMGEKTLNVKIDKAKQAIMKEDKAITAEQAEALVFENDGDLYNEYLAEQEAR